jgi:hypothetical protein
MKGINRNIFIIVDQYQYPTVRYNIFKVLKMDLILKNMLEVAKEEDIFII